MGLHGMSWGSIKCVWYFKHNAWLTLSTQWNGSSCCSGYFAANQNTCLEESIYCFSMTTEISRSQSPVTMTQFPKENMRKRTPFGFQRDCRLVSSPSQVYFPSPSPHISPGVNSLLVTGNVSELSHGSYTVFVGILPNSAPSRSSSPKALNWSDHSQFL